MTIKHWLIACLAAIGLAGVAPAAAPAPVATDDAAAIDSTVDVDANGEGAADAATAQEVVRPFDYAVPEGSKGLPDGRMGLQDQYTEIGQRAADFHDIWLMPLITLISVFVLVLLIWAMFRYRRGANPEPSRTTHNVALEVAWTILPVIALVIIAVPSIGLIRAQYSPPPADVTIKVTGHQWYWSYEYPDNGVEIISNMLKEQDDPTLPEGARYRTDADGPALLAVDERVVIPVGKTVKFIVTASDVLHSFAIPAFWTKMDAVPGRLNETWVKVEEEGVYFGQCSELCGSRHAYMPIAIEVVSQERYEEWIRLRGGIMEGTVRGGDPAAETAGPANDNDAADEAAETADATA
ncbi:cytochrome c oxidase subunit II [Sphingomicrobium marinum]|uniref:cytochrome c oxidase subunit II n=1 Tax=Sphingomicrobium marinum TaxID=1227950 RepID=UPI00223F2053|nr:cytochrome c oxidase subunit II [Sphingomicrobium marinum]